MNTVHVINCLRLFYCLRSDLTFILTTVSLLLPSVSGHTPSSAPHPHISLIHAHCSTLLSLTTNNNASINNGDLVISSWQDGIPIGCHGYRSTKELIGYLVSHPNPPKELLVEVSTFMVRFSCRTCKLESVPNFVN